MGDERIRGRAPANRLSGRPVGSPIERRWTVLACDTCEHIVASEPLDPRYDPIVASCEMCGGTVRQREVMPVPAEEWQHRSQRHPNDTAVKNEAAPEGLTREQWAAIKKAVSYVGAFDGQTAESARVIFAVLSRLAGESE